MSVEANIFYWKVKRQRSFDSIPFWMEFLPFFGWQIKDFRSGTLSCTPRHSISGTQLMSEGRNQSWPTQFALWIVFAKLFDILFYIFIVKGFVAYFCMGPWERVCICVVLFTQRTVNWLSNYKSKAVSSNGTSKRVLWKCKLFALSPLCNFVIMCACFLNFEGIGIGIENEIEPLQLQNYAKHYTIRTAWRGPNNKQRSPGK